MIPHYDLSSTGYLNYVAVGATVRIVPYGYLFAFVQWLLLYDSNYHLIIAKTSDKT